jgi:hypothetical protein
VAASVKAVGEMLRQLACERNIEVVVAERSANDDERGTRPVFWYAILGGRVGLAPYYGQESRVPA